MVDNSSEELACGVPTLVHNCQKVLAANIDAISSFGNNIPHRLIEPILKSCNADTLLRLEKETPSLEGRTSELWETLCLKTYPLLVHTCDISAPWKDTFFALKHKEERRFEEAASKARSQRLEAEKHKRKRQVQLTHHLPTPKRHRQGFPSGPKTLFEKTRQEATKIQNSRFGSRSTRPLNGASGSQTRLGAPSAQTRTRNQDGSSANTFTIRATGSGSLPNTVLQSTTPLQQQASRNRGNISPSLTRPGITSRNSTRLNPNNRNT